MPLHGLLCSSAWACTYFRACGLKATDLNFPVLDIANSITPRISLAGGVSERRCRAVSAPLRAASSHFVHSGILALCEDKPSPASGLW